jgi:hypothetical protein
MIRLYIIFILACGYIFCDTCTKHRTIIPLLDNNTPERVCDDCYHNLQSQTLSSIFQNNNFSTQRTPITEYATNNTNSPATHGSFGKLLINIHISNFTGFVTSNSSKFI